MRGLILLLLALCLSLPNPVDAGGLDSARDIADVYSGSHALLIGASDYSETSWDSLPGVRRDMDEVAELLGGMGFDIERVQPPLTRQNIRQAVEQFFETHGGQRNNQLLVYYAGHGTTLRDAHEQLTGFIVPVDAELPSSDLRAESYTEAIEMSWLASVASRPAVRAKHVLFMFDSCFSGSVFQRKRGGGERTALIDFLANQDVRQFISSGTHAQEVPDKSVFARMFREALAGNADLNGDGYITGTELGQFLRETVSNITRARQTPQFARMSANGTDFGEFLFVSPIAPHGDEPSTSGTQQETAALPGNRFRSCDQCPEMVMIPAGTALLGSPESEKDRDSAEPLPTSVQISGGFALSIYEITERQWAGCFREGGCTRWLPMASSEANQPVAGISWEDAHEYTLWLSARSGSDYRLPSAAEWEYAARAGSTSARHWGESIGENLANCRGCGSAWDGRSAAPVGSFPANRFGVHDMLGNVWEWVQDCEASETTQAPLETTYQCVLKGGSYGTSPVSVRSAAIGRYPADRAQMNFGFRVLRQP